MCLLPACLPACRSACLPIAWERVWHAFVSLEAGTRTPGGWSCTCLLSCVWTPQGLHETCTRRLVAATTELSSTCLPLHVWPRKTHLGGRYEDSVLERRVRNNTRRMFRVTDGVLHLDPPRNPFDHAANRRDLVSRLATFYGGKGSRRGRGGSGGRGGREGGDGGKEGGWVGGRESGCGGVWGQGGARDAFYTRAPMRAHLCRAHRCTS
jgi:uncharacterized membrane protein YgcG